MNSRDKVGIESIMWTGRSNSSMKIHEIYTASFGVHGRLGPSCIRHWYVRTQWRIYIVILDTRPILGSILFIFVQFSANFGPITGWCPLFRLAPPLGNPQIRLFYVCVWVLVLLLFLFLWHAGHLLLTCAVVDPGFPRGWGVSPRMGCANLLFHNFFCQKVHEY